MQLFFIFLENFNYFNYFNKKWTHIFALKKTCTLSTNIYIYIYINIYIDVRGKIA